MPGEEFYADLEQMYLDDERAYWNTGPPTPNASLEREREEQTPPARAGVSAAEQTETHQGRCSARAREHRRSR